MNKFLKRLGEWFSKSILLIDESAKRDPEDSARGPYAVEKDPELVSKLVSRSGSYRVPDYIKPVPPAAAALRVERPNGVRTGDFDPVVVRHEPPHDKSEPTTIAPVEAALAAHDAARAAGQPPEAALDAAKAAASKARANVPKTAAKSPVAKPAPKDVKKAKVTPAPKKAAPAASSARKPTKKRT